MEKEEKEEVEAEEEDIKVVVVEEIMKWYIGVSDVMDLLHFFIVAAVIGMPSKIFGMPSKNDANDAANFKHKSFSIIQCRILINSKSNFRWTSELSKLYYDYWFQVLNKWVNCFLFWLCTNFKRKK